MVQGQFPKPPSESLPTMYDLPSESPEDWGLPDEFHEFQPKLLRETCQIPTYPAADVFIGADLNLYYDGRHPQWYKRPDWFLALGVRAAQRLDELRLSYVMWQEFVSPFLVVELLSPGTEDEDLGEKVRSLGRPPLKWEVYERILRVPFYGVYDRYENRFRMFAMEGGRYQEMVLTEMRFWLDELGLGLGVWEGIYQGIEGRWLRWYDATGSWVATQAERVEQAEVRAEQAEIRAERLAARLRELGLEE